MSKNQRPTARQPATKFANLQKKLRQQSQQKAAARQVSKGKK